MPVARFSDLVETDRASLEVRNTPGLPDCAERHEKPESGAGAGRSRAVWESFRLVWRRVNRMKEVRRGSLSDGVRSAGVSGGPHAPHSAWRAWDRLRGAV